MAVRNRLSKREIKPRKDAIFDPNRPALFVFPDIAGFGSNPLRSSFVLGVFRIQKGS
uniref:Uncharacterized protein n=1 Tax=Solanum lycopersicum TaxID=4081 RepID=A0A3Q7EY96_SOLLC